MTDGNVAEVNGCFLFPLSKHCKDANVMLASLQVDKASLAKQHPFIYIKIERQAVACAVLTTSKRPFIGQPSPIQSVPKQTFSKLGKRQ